MRFGKGEKKWKDLMLCDVMFSQGGEFFKVHLKLVFFFLLLVISSYIYKNMLGHQKFDV